MRQEFNYYLRYLIILTFLMLYKSYTGQQYSFYNFNENNGLSKNAVLSINQNDKGEILLGTNDGGLDIINGIEFKSITKNEGLIDNVVYDIINIGSQEQLLSTNNGLDLLNKKEIHHFPFKDSLSSTRIYTVLKSKKNKVWLATGKGLAILEDDTIVAFYSKNEDLNNTPIIHIREDNNGGIWCATMGKGVFLLKPDESIEHYQFGDKLEYTFHTFQFDESTVWFLTYIGIFEFKDNQISEVTFNCNKHLTNVYYHSCIRDSQNNIWIATLKGVIKIDKEGNETLFTMDNGLAGEDAWKIFEDREGNIWITFKTAGVSKLTNEAFYLYNKSIGLSSQDIKAIYIDNNKDVLLGTLKGVDKFLNRDSVENVNVGYSSKDNIKSIKQIGAYYYFLAKEGLNVYYNNIIKNYNTSG